MLPALVAASLLGGVSLIGLDWLSQREDLLAALALGAAAAAVATCRQRPLGWLLAMLGGALCLGAWQAPARAPLDAYRTLHSGLARLTLRIGRSGCGDQGCWAEGTLRDCTPIDPASCVASGARVGVASATPLPAGATVRALGKLAVRAAFFDVSRATRWPDTRPRLTASLHDGSRPRVIALAAHHRWIATTRDAARATLQNSLSAPHAGIARALLLGEGSAVETALNEAIRSAGVSHVLAVSGMHVTLLVGALVALVRWLWLYTRWASAWEATRVSAALGVALAPLIAALCGGSPSAVRAAWTSTLMYLVVALGARPSPLAVSALVVAAHAVADPDDALHPGFVLSVLATAALLTQRAAGQGVLGALRESGRAWIATAPFLLLCFGQTSLVALLANVALLPLGTALVPLAAVHLGIAGLGLDGLLPSGGLFELASAAFLEASRRCAARDPGLTVPPLTSVQAIALWAVAAACMFPLRRRTRAMLLAGAVVGAGVSELALRSDLGDDALRVTMLDVGQGDAVLIETGAGSTMLIDAGGSVGGGPDPGAAAVVPALWARRVTRLDVVVLSHPHPDHYGGLAAVLDAVAVGELWDTGQAEAEADPALGQGAVAMLLEKARQRGVRVRRPDALCDRAHRLGPAALRVLAPCPAFDVTRGPNDNSFVLRLVHGAHSFLFTGDAEREAEASLVARGGALRSDVLKVAHHGSRSSSTAALLGAVAPHVALVSAGRGNRFGHPHDEVLARLSAAVPRVRRTDLSGSIALRSDGRTLWLASAAAPREVVVPTGRAALLSEAQEHEADARDRAQE